MGDQESDRKLALNSKIKFLMIKKEIDLSKNKKAIKFKMIKFLKFKIVCLLFMIIVKN